MSEIDWAAIGAALRAPLDPAVVDFRVQGGRPYERDGRMMARVVAYIDARAVADRLDEAVGPGAWSFDWQSVTTNNGVLTAAKGTLSIHGVAKSDIGDAGETEPAKAAVSDALKRTAVLWGIGRYLYDVGTFTAEVRVEGGKIMGLANGAADRLRAKLPRPGRTAPAPVADEDDAPPAPRALPPPRPTAPTETGPATEAQRAAVQTAYPGMAAEAIARLTAAKAQGMIAAAAQRAMGAA